MPKGIALFLAALLLLPPFALVQGQEKPVAALGRVATLGEVSEAQKKIIINRLEGFLSNFYDLVSQAQYARAEEEAFAALDLEQCTEEQCIRKIQELLQVDRLFILQIIREEEITQLTLNLVREDSKRVVEKICDRCSITQLYGEINALTRQLIAEDLGVDIKELIAAQPSAPVQAIQPEEDEGLPLWVWIVGGLALAGLAASSSGGSESAAPATTTTTTDGGSTGGTVGFSY